MHFTTLLTSTLALAMSISAAPTPATPANTRYVQLRLYSDPACGQDGNLGELGVYGDDVNKCNAFGDYTVESVSFEYAINNCTVSVYTDQSCQAGAQSITLDTCLSENAQYGSYQVFCSQL
ncbi:uncharacterized protein N7483_008765 [Penicillium malachiteum]|uniref:uncharacterized protein n=1 Tax=Penicillium malachiteum TaxID=1324776 RepID=UPI0025487D3D|nr:uncharacterized protein N7483_008765 [Penicillium malachiteum]KAJ5720831.1 hypothetical protein N7483_008765 [Penicillium malachiteum]